MKLKHPIFHGIHGEWDPRIEILSCENVLRKIENYDRGP